MQGILGRQQLFNSLSTRADLIREHDSASRQLKSAARFEDDSRHRSNLDACDSLHDACPESSPAANKESHPSIIGVISCPFSPLLFRLQGSQNFLLRQAMTKEERSDLKLMVW